MILFLKDNEIIILRWNQTCISSKTATNYSRKKNENEKYEKQRKRKTLFFNKYNKVNFVIN